MSLDLDDGGVLVESRSRRSSESGVRSRIERKRGVGFEELGLLLCSLRLHWLSSPFSSTLLSSPLLSTPTLKMPFPLLLASNVQLNNPL